jgi:hypothetical protein
MKRISSTIRRGFPLRPYEALSCVNNIDTRAVKIKKNKIRFHGLLERRLRRRKPDGIRAFNQLANEPLFSFGFFFFEAFFIKANEQTRLKHKIHGCDLGLYRQSLKH